MPSPFPAGVIVATVTLGAPRGPDGRLGKFVGMALVCDRKIIHAASGQPLYPDPVNVTPRAGDPLVVQVPLVDQDGYVDETGAAITGWSYVLSGRVSFNSSDTRRLADRRFQVSGSQRDVNLDLIPSGVSIPPIQLPPATVLSVAGHTGAVSIEQLVDDLSQNLTPGDIGAATPAQITAAITQLVNLAPAALDTLGEIATQLATDESAAAAILGALNTHKSDHANPHAVTKAQVGLESVANLAPADLPVSTAQAQAISVAINNLVNAAPGALDTLGEIAAQMATDESAAAAILAALTSHTGNTGNPHQTTKAQVGLGSVDNTPDSAKPVSTAQAAADTAARDAAIAAAATDATTKASAAQAAAITAAATDATTKASAAQTAAVAAAATDATAKVAAEATVARAAEAALVPKAGGTMTGPLVLSGDPIVPLGAATQQYVQARVADLTSGSPAQLDTFLETYNRFLADESALSALTTAMAGKQAADDDLAALAGIATKPYGRNFLGLETQAQLMALLAGASPTVPGIVQLATGGTFDKTDDLRAVTSVQVAAALAASNADFATRVVAKAAAPNIDATAGDGQALSNQAAALAAVGGGTILIDDTYTITDAKALTLSSNVRLQGVSPRAKIVIAVTSGRPITNAVGTVTVTGTISAADTTLTVPAGTVTATDVGRWMSLPGLGYTGLDLTARVKSVTDSTHVVLDRPAVSAGTGVTCTLARGDRNIRISDLEVTSAFNPTGVPGGPNPVPGVAGMSFTYVDGLMVDGCHLHNLPSVSMITLGATRTLITGNNIHGNGRDGINCSGGLGLIDGLAVVNNVIDGVGDDKVQIGWSNTFHNTAGRHRNIVVAGNELTGDRSGSSIDVGRGIVLVGCEDFVIAANKISDTSSSGIVLVDNYGGISTTWPGGTAIDPSTGLAWTTRNGQIGANTVVRAGQNAQYQPANVTKHFGTGIHLTRAENILVGPNLVKDSFQKPDIWVDADCVNVLVDPSNWTQDPANGGLVDARERVVATVATSNVPTLTGMRTLSGYTTTGNEVVLLTAQTDPTQNGPWLVPIPVTDSRLKPLGSWVRPLWWPHGLSTHGAAVQVTDGTYAGRVYALTSTTQAPIRVGFAAQTWSHVPPAVKALPSLPAVIAPVR